MKKGYDAIASIYDRLAKLIFGKSIRQSQTVFFNDLQDCNSVLVIGGGTGQWLNRLIREFPHLKITFVDSSSEMIRLAKAKLKTKEDVRFIYGTIDSIAINEKFDAVLLFFFLDLFSEEELPDVLSSIHTRMSVNSIWLVTDFVNHARWQNVFLKVMYLFFGQFTGLKTKQLPDWKSNLELKGLTKIKFKSFYNEFIHATVYQSK